MHKELKEKILNVYNKSKQVYGYRRIKLDILKVNLSTCHSLKLKKIYLEQLMNIFIVTTTIGFNQY